MTKNGATLAYIYDAANRLNEIHQGSQGGPLREQLRLRLRRQYDPEEERLRNYNSDRQLRCQGQARRTSRANTFTYDPLDYRIAKTDSTGSKSYLLQGEHLEAIYHRGKLGAPCTSGVWLSTGSSTATKPHLPAPGSTIPSTTTICSRCLGLSGHDGTVLQTISYGPFGEKIGTTGNANNNTLHFTGREENPDSGLYYYRARYYDPTLGRFLTEDPKGFAAGVNFYAYECDNPANICSS